VKSGSAPSTTADTIPLAGSARRTPSRIGFGSRWRPRPETEAIVTNILMLHGLCPTGATRRTGRIEVAVRGSGGSSGSERAAQQRDAADGRRR